MNEMNMRTILHNEKKKFSSMCDFLSFSTRSFFGKKSKLKEKTSNYDINVNRKVLIETLKEVSVI